MRATYTRTQRPLIIPPRSPLTDLTLSRILPTIFEPTVDEIDRRRRTNQQ
jgi:hypothetical protein